MKGWKAKVLAVIIAVIGAYGASVISAAGEDTYQAIKDWCWPQQMESKPN